MAGNLSDRQCLLLRTIQENVKPMASAELCGVLGISPRTLRYDIQSINAAARNKVIGSGKNGYFISHEDEAADLYGDGRREKTLASRLCVALLEEGNRSIYDLEGVCYASSSSIVSTLSTVADQVAPFGLSIHRRGDTVQLIGDEYGKRRMLSSLLFSEAASISKSDTDLGGVTLGDVRGMVDVALKDSSLTLDGVYRTGAIISLAAVINRILAGHCVESVPHSETELKSRTEYPFIASLAQQISERYGVDVTVDEFVCMQMFVAGYFKSSNGGHLDILCNPNLRGLVRQILDATAAHYHVALDNELMFDNLVIHIHYLLIRASSMGNFQTEVSDFLLQAHPLLYDMAVFICDRLARTFKVSIAHDEIGLVALYLGCAIHDDNHYGSVRAACVCPQYSTLREMIFEQVRRQFSERIDIVGVFDSIEDIDADEVDFIISTRRNEPVAGNVVFVSPIMTPREIHAVEKRMMTAFKRRRTREIRRQLLELFDPAFFFIENRDLNVDEVLAIMNRPLLEKGVVDKDFPESVRRREELATTAFFQSFALPHALDAHAQRTVIVYLYNEKPIDWHGERVHLVLLLASEADNTSFAKTYTILFDILTDPKLFQRLIQVRTFDALTAFIDGCEP